MEPRQLGLGGLAVWMMGEYIAPASGLSGALLGKEMHKRLGLWGCWEEKGPKEQQNQGAQC